MRRKGGRLATTHGLMLRLQEPGTVCFPTSPSHFDARCQPDLDLLKLFHASPRDFNVVFEAAAHVYHLHGRRSHGSVTQVIHSFCKAFDAHAVVAGMKSGSRWPRAGYLRTNPDVRAFARVAQLEPGLLPLSAALPRDEPQICRILQALNASCEIDSGLQALTLSDEEILAKWSSAAQEAAHYGTYMHRLFELFLNGQAAPQMSPELGTLRNILAELPPDTQLWRTEWEIYGKDENLAGSIDFCARLLDGTFMLADWKRTAGLQNKFRSTSMMQKPLSHLYDCSGMQYRLQLNAYRYLLEKYYDMTVSRMLVVCCHPEHDPFPLVDEVARLEAETESMMSTLSGSAPDGFLINLPGHYFSWDFLSTLAAVSKTMLA